MILREIQIDGFGVHHDLRHSFSPNLNLIVGPNEAGKTTLHAYVRGLLYGFPRRNAEDHYSALRGGRHGGTLSLETEDGVYRILRSGEPRRTLSVELPGGGVGGQEVLDRLLRKTDGQLFRNVFAFGLDELMSFGNLMGPEMEMRIFDTAVAGAGRSVTQIVGELREIQQEELKARSGRVRELAARIGELEKELGLARAQAKGYAGIAEEERRLGVAAKEARARAGDARREAQRWGALVSLWPTESRRQEGVRILNELPGREPDAPLIGAERLTRFEHLQEQLGEVSGEERALLLQEERLGRELEEAASSEALRAVADRAATLLREQPLQRDRKERMQPLRLSIEQRSEAASKLLQSLGAGWSEELVRGIDASLSRREEIDAFVSRSRDNDRERERGLAALRGAGAASEQALRQLEETERLIEEHGEGESQGALDRRAGALAELRAAKEELIQLERRRDSLRDRRGAMAQGSAPGEGGGWIRPVLWAGAGIFAAVAAVGLALSSVPVFWVAAVAALLFAGLALLWRTPTRGGPSLADGASSAAAEAEVEELIRRSEAAIHRYADELGLQGMPSASEIETAAEALLRGRAHLHRREDLQRERRERERRSLEAASPLAEAKGEQERLEAESAALREEWGRCLAAVFGALVDEVPLSPLSARDRLVRVDELVKLLDEKVRDEVQLARLEETIGEWDRELAAVIAAVRIEGGGDEALGRLSVALEEERAKAAERVRLEEERRKLGEGRRLAEGKRERLETAAAELLREAGVGDREELAARIEEDRLRREALKEIDDAKRSIEERLGLGSEADAIRLELERGEVGHWRAEQERAEAEAASLDEELEERIRALTRVEEKRGELEDSADVPRVAAELAQVRVELEGAVRRWRTAALLERLLQSSLDDLRRERQPAVLRAAGEAFGRITGGRYSSILQSLAGDGLEVLDEKERRIPASSLSRGTREQLYISVRLGLAAAFSEQGTRLPLMLDDVLVNFDPERAEKGAKVLVDHAARHQTLLFTCHPKTVERILTLAPEAAVLELANPKRNR